MAESLVRDPVPNIEALLAALPPLPPRGALVGRKPDPVPGWHLSGPTPASVYEIFRSDSRTPEERLDALLAELDALPPLRDWIREVFLNGGWHKYSAPPPMYEWYKEADGTNPNGHVYYRNRRRDLGKRVPVERASRESTLSNIREMRRVGWTHDKAYEMCRRYAAKGNEWILEQPDFDAEFERCWAKASVPVSDLQKRRLQPSEGYDGFVSHPRDRDAVWAFIEASPGMGLRELRRSHAGLTGKHINGRLDAALGVLTMQGRISTETGPNRKKFHYVVESTPVGRKYVMAHLTFGAATDRKHALEQMLKTPSQRGSERLDSLISFVEGSDGG